MMLGGMSVQSVSITQWDELLRAFPAHTVFHRRAWLEVVRDIHHVKMLLIGVQRSDGAFDALWPLLQLRKGPFRVVGSPLRGWSTAYMGPLVAADAEPAATLKSLMSFPPVRRPAYFEIKALTHPHHLDFGAMGFERSKDFETYLLDLSRSEDDLWNNLKQECRTRIRKARKACFEIRQETTNGFVDECWAIATQVFARTHLTPSFSREFLTTMWKRLAPTGEISVISAWHQGERAGYILLLHDHAASYYWAGGAKTEYLNTGINNLLQWEAIQAARSRGSHTYDFISSAGGPGRFKKTFNPEAKIVAAHWHRTGSRIAAMLKRAYEKRQWRKRHVADTPEDDQ